MILRVDGRRYRGPVASVHGVDPRGIAAAIRRDVRRDGDRSTGRRDPAAAGDAAPAIAVDTADPGPVHEYVCSPPAGRQFPLVAALAAAARSRGREAPQDGEIASVERRIADLDPDPPATDRAELRRRVATVAEEERRLAERVSELRGEVQLLRDRDETSDDASERLQAAVADLTEARTERMAAEQRLEDLEERLGEARDRREKRLELVDRRDNLRRAARRHLAAEAWPAFRSALRTVPGTGEAGDRPGSFQGSAATARLAVVRVADLSAPVVVDGDRFPDARTARRRLAAPVVLVTDRQSRGSEGGARTEESEPVPLDST